VTSPAGARARTLPELIDQVAEIGGRRIFLEAEDQVVTYERLSAAVSLVAGALEGLDPHRGAPVAIGSRNLSRAIMCWCAQAWRGGTTALIHAALRGNSLVHALNLTQSEILVADYTLIERVMEERAAFPHLRVIVALDGVDRPVEPRGLTLISWADLDMRPGARRQVRPEDPCTIMFTSGTTGPAKAVLKSHRYETTYGYWAADGVELETRHTMWSCSPYAHTRTANATIIAAASVGARVVLGSGYRPETFWRDAQAAGATHTLISSALANRLMALPPSADDRCHRVEVIHCLPGPHDPAAFMDRFNVKLTGQGYGSTEIYAAPQQLRRQDWTKPASFAGRPHPLIHAVVCDESGEPVPTDGITAGELRVRPMHRFDMFTEYYSDPAATAAAFRDGWFCTGDRFTWDDDGNLYFAGRTKDSIRYSGENVSAWEIENAVAQLAGVVEAAAFGVPSERGEQDIRLDLIVNEPLEFDDIIAHLRHRLPRFMVPRYLAFRRDFPRTPSGKIRTSGLAESESEIIGEIFDRVGQR
jgi:crotonobetaine/carnitine-CoA ligase